MNIINFFKNIFNKTNRKIYSEYKKSLSMNDKFTSMSDQDIDDRVSFLHNEIYNDNSKLYNHIAEAAAIVREVAKRTLNQKHFDVQLLAGIAMTYGKIIDMKTGEGKTLSSTIPAFIHGLKNNGVIIVTANEYLAKRDADFVEPLFKRLGLTIGVLDGSLKINERIKVMSSNIVYTTSHSICFEYLRNNLSYNKHEVSVNNFDFCIVDECDFVLIDEARVPLSLTSSSNVDKKTYMSINKIVKFLKQEDLDINIEKQDVHLTNEGIEKVERLLKGYNLIKESLYTSDAHQILHCLQEALIANEFYHKGKQYIVKGNKIILIDKMTGRIQDGRSFRNGLQQAIEAKEGVSISPETLPLASITYQNFFHMFHEITGMSGTAMNDIKEYSGVYKLNVFEIPTNKKMIRIDHQDEIYTSTKAKNKNILNLIKKCIKKNQPVLIGTNYIDTSEELSLLLKSNNIKHVVLNAKNHHQESEIIEDAGKAGNVTIATSMAGRGADIKLGGKNATDEEYEAVKNAGGLYVIGAERYSSRRVDDQLRGRSGRQGDPGESKFFVSLEDEFMKMFVTPRVGDMIKKLSSDSPDSPISNRIISKSIYNGQKKIEGFGMMQRKNLIDYDSIIDKQRKLIYNIRHDILFCEDMPEHIIKNIKFFINKFIENSISEFYETDDIEVLKKIGKDVLDFDNVDLNRIPESFKDEVNLVIFNNLKSLEDNEKKISDIKKIILYTIDIHWQQYLLLSSGLKQSIDFKSYGSSDPLHAYRKESYNLFMDAISNISKSIVIKLSNIIQ